MLMKYLSIKRLTWLCIAALSTPVFTSCDMMTEDRDDCPMGLYLNFKYDSILSALTCSTTMWEL